MAQPFLEPAEEAILYDASEDGVLAAMIRLGSSEFPSDRWLGRGNRYGDSVLSKIRTDTGSSSKSLSDADIADYVAASAPLHCADGWSFLGGAVAAHSRGDSDGARHLAYYAELRAAMSTLACFGVGIFDDRHIVVHADGTVSWLRSKQTHVMTWLAFERWARLPRTASVLGELFRPQSIAIDEWVTAMTGGSAWQPVASKWLQSWGLDLSLFESDRSARNESSYRPTRLAGRRSLDVPATVAFLRDLWLAFEPTASTFAQLDLHLLRKSLESVFEGIHDSPPRKMPEEWQEAVDRVLDANTEEGALRDALRAFLLRTDGSRDISLLRHAARGGTPNQPDHHLRVMSRAALLLRVASGCCARLFFKAGVTAADINFWWELFGDDRGLWVPRSAPTPLTTLWADIEAALDDIDDITSADASTTASFRQFLDACALQIVVLSSCERIGLWSLAA